MRDLETGARGGQIADDAIHGARRLEQDRPALEGALPWQLAAFYLHDEAAPGFAARLFEQR